MRRCFFWQKKFIVGERRCVIRVVGHACRRRTLRFLCGVVSGRRTRVSATDPYDSSAVLRFRRERAPPYRLLQRSTIQKPSGFPNTIHHSPFTIHRVHILCGVGISARASPHPTDCSNALQSKSRQAFPSPFSVNHSPFTLTAALRYNKSRRPADSGMMLVWFV